MKHVLALMMLSFLLSLTLLAVGAAGHDDATPAGGAGASGAVVASGSLAGMLGPLPALSLNGEAAPTVSYANVATQLEAVGVPAPRDLDDREALSG